MKILVVFASCAAVASAGSLSYSAPSSSGGFGNGGYSSDFSMFGNSGGFTGGQSNLGIGSIGGFRSSSGSNSGFGRRGSNSGTANGRGNAGFQGQQQQGGQVRRFISVHVAPEVEAPREPRIIQAGGPPDTHYNIIFVKAPSGGNQQKTEVVLPEPPKQKTLVYVLIKRPDENQETVKITKPNPTKPSKPEVYFIRYKPDGENGSSQANGNGLNGRGSAGFNDNGNSLDSSYGPPSQQNGAGSIGGY